MPDPPAAVATGAPRGSGALALEVAGIAKSFGGLVALDSVSLWARAGQVTAIVGDNGAGKSTLIKCVTGVQRPDKGTIKISGREVVISRPEDARNAGIETVYQDLSLVDDLSVVQNFFLGREVTRSFGPFRWLDRKEMSQRVAASLSALSVNVPSPGARIRRLSGGQRQAIATARAAMFGSKLVIMDEPTASLGVQETARVEQVIRRLRDQGVSIVLISHDMRQVLRLADRVWVLRSGRLAGGGPAAGMTGDRLVALITGVEQGVEQEEEDRT
ncbi:MAG: ATP-binding cassette domain-containing protein [Acidimicrobiales bacterium]